MASESVHPLRISKGSTTTSPSKMSGVPRPLSEIPPTEKRRNSPSWTQTSPQKMSLTLDSSPFQPSPTENTASPRLFWQARNSDRLPHVRSGSPSPNRRTSIERLQRASRVKNSNILALEQKQEYDPTRLPQIERPLSKVQGSSLGLSASLGLRSSDSEQSQADARPALATMNSFKSPLSRSIDAFNAESAVAGKESMSPTKSSMSPSKFKNSFDHDSSLWSADSSFNERELPVGHSLHRHAKSVTFDAAPPQINEYEMATPDISSIGSDSREGSYESIEDDEEEESVLYEPGLIDIHEDSFDASLEDTDKTPVVGPDDWRGDSPMVHHALAQEEYEGSPMPEAAPSTATAGRPCFQRNDSTTSNGDHRPLPPLPGASRGRSHSASSNRASPSLAATAEKMLGSQRSLPVPPPAFASKSDIQNIGNSKMSLEDRLKLMMMSDDTSAKTVAEQQRERRLRRGGGRDRFASPMSEEDSFASAAEIEDTIEDTIEADEADDTLGDMSALGDYQLPPRISRESIMRRVNGNKAFDRESDYNFSSPAPTFTPQQSPERSPTRFASLDPDVPIPSTEESFFGDLQDQEGGSVIITRNSEDENDESVFDIYEPSELEERQESQDFAEAETLDDDDESRYSDTGTEPHAEPAQLPIEEAPLAPTAAVADLADRKPSLPDFEQYSTGSAFSRDFESFMLPKPRELDVATIVDESRSSTFSASVERPITPTQSYTKPEYDGTGWGEPDDEFDDEPGTPESVIHHPVSDESEETDIFEQEETPEVVVELPKESPAIPERLATIKASGSKLKTRVSNTPADLAAMRDARRQVSYEVPGVPPIPEKHQNRLSRDFKCDKDLVGDEFLERHPSFKNRSLTLDIDLGLSLDQDFERVIESQKRGYLMRQNTKLVAASDNDSNDVSKARSAGNSPVKQDRPQSWTVEPWNGRPRQRSMRKQSATMSGPVPPMPGYESNAQTLTQVVEEDVGADLAVDSGERGRLFVKVMGVKDLDLPMPKNERTWFSLTLDNGVHCVTTAWLEMARNAPIGQEFELVVPNDLEFQLTLNVKLEKPAPVPVNTAAKSSKTKTSAFSRVFASPKKRKELELRQREEDERYAQQQSLQRNAPPTAYELLSPLVAEDGSFGRSYVCLKEHEHRCFGRPYMAEVSCFNEWATEEAGFASSVKSKRGNTAVVRRAPYKIGKLELQLLFVPRPKNSLEEDMPKSMNTCIRELKATEERLARNWEGPLSQQGGDCPYWRRRYFKLAGTKLTAYHEATRQPRATINLSNTKRLIDDRRALTEKETVSRGGKRRRSAFAEDEEGYMFVEEGFRIRFNNGEVIDFYADTAEDKEGWMKVLSEVVGRGDGVDEDGSGPRSRAKWCEHVLKREEQLRRRSNGKRVHSRTKSMHI